MNDVLKEEPQFCIPHDPTLHPGPTFLQFLLTTISEHANYSVVKVRNKSWLWLIKRRTLIASQWRDVNFGLQHESLLL